MKADASGFPRRSAIADELLKPETSFLAYFLTCGNVVDKSIERGVQPDEFYQYTLRGELWEDVLRDMKTFEQDAKEREKNGVKTRLVKITQVASKRPARPPKESGQIPTASEKNDSVFSKLEPDRKPGETKK
ncbi:hypothetical protein HK405_013249, partial [Cladochytrium tenue]